MAARDTRPLLLFFTSETSGPGRRMESLLAYLARKERERLRVTRVDVGRSPELAKSLGVTAIPALVLVADGKPAARLEGRVSAPQIESMLAPHLEKPTPSNPDRSLAA